MGIQFCLLSVETSCIACARVLKYVLRRRTLYLYKQGVSQTDNPEFTDKPKFYQLLVCVLFKKYCMLTLFANILEKHFVLTQEKFIYENKL